MRRRSIVLISVVAAVVIAAVILVVLMIGMGSGGTESSAPVESDDDFGTAQVYDVDDGALVPAADTRESSVWEVFVRLVTPEFAATSMTQYRAGDDPDSDTLAYVHRADDPDYWVLAANMAFADDDQLLLSTLIHEYAHILSLGVADADPDTTSCPTVELSEGCLAADSLLLAFYDDFWLRYGDVAPAPDDDDADAAAEFFLAHEEDFVSDYAATNVVEDFAESFMTFVLEDEPEDTSPVAEKLLFFWNVPEYVDIRERIRTEFDLG